jgi:NAD(P)-dependent dehydrogenase (short-subunit alcohol dehydrogenase family)
LALANYHVVIIARDRARAEAAQIWIAHYVPHASIELVVADLSLLSATRDAGEFIASRHPTIDVLVNNAGIFDAKPVITMEGHERVLAINLLAPFVLTVTLLPALFAGAPARIVNIGSSTSDRASIDPDHLALGKNWTMTRAYGQSKLALMMTTFALARRLREKGVVANVVHPGLVATGLVRSGGIIGLAWRCMAPFALSEERGADTALFTALAPEMATVSGLYLKNRRAVRPNHRALDRVLVERVWAATERLTAKPAQPTQT